MNILNKKFTFTELFGATEMKEGGKIDKEKVETEVRHIQQGAGWTTDEYISNHTDLNTREQYAVMIELAKKRILYAEEKLSQDEMVSDIEPSEHARMSVKDVEKEYGSAKQRMVEGGKLKVGDKVKDTKGRIGVITSLDPGIARVKYDDDKRGSRTFKPERELTKIS